VPREYPSNRIFVDFDVEGHGDLLGDSRAAPAAIPLLHFNDRTDEFCARLSGLACVGDSLSIASDPFACSRLGEAAN